MSDQNEEERRAEAESLAAELQRREDVEAEAFRVRTLAHEPRTVVVIDLLVKAWRVGHARGILDAIDVVGEQADEAERVAAEHAAGVSVEPRHEQRGGPR